MNFWVMAAFGLFGGWATLVVSLLWQINTELTAIRYELKR